MTFTLQHLAIKVIDRITYVALNVAEVLTPEFVLRFFYASMLIAGTDLLVSGLPFTLTWLDGQVWFGVTMHGEHVLYMFFLALLLPTHVNGKVYTLATMPMFFYVAVLIAGILDGGISRIGVTAVIYLTSLFFMGIHSVYVKVERQKLLQMYDELRTEHKRIISKVDYGESPN